ncbi:MAG: pantetheine-phosphate adenylyltransferase [Aequorivita sp.]|nr:pantetheine-phosphate adenylyltransferase [Aequorivita sp.]|tara:strand:+ start:76 stop:513 length:438 start_codon:yes stop_codon:yes gene_type:complete
MRRAVFPGTFDPITLGHVDIIKRALPLFDELIIAIGTNSDKKTMFSLEERIKFIEDVFKNESQIKVKSYTGLTANFCKNEKAQFIVRGLRNSIDFAYEQSIAQANAKVNGVDSVFLICSPEYSHISSSIVRDIARHDGDYQDLIP